MKTGGPPLAAWARAIRRSAMEEMLEATARPNLISLALGLPAADLLPSQELASAIARTLAGDARALQYAPPSDELRRFVATLMRRRGVACEPEQIFLTAGAQQGMSLLLRLLLDPGSTVLVEEHCYPGFAQAATALGHRLAAVPSSLDQGIDLEAVERALKRAHPPSLLYAIADGHNPLGVSLPLAARRRLVEMAAFHGVPILEDDAYGLLSYDGQEPPALRAFDSEWVLYAGSFSKTLAPSLRTGWVVVPERLLGPLSSLKESSDINTATLGQRAVAAFVASGRFDDHLGRLRAAYARRRDAMMEVIDGAMPPGSRFTRPRAGFFTWLELPEGVDAIRLFHHALEQDRVAVLPGAAFAVDEATTARPALRLNFSFSDPGAIVEGVGRLARSIAALSREPAGGRIDA